MSHPNSGGTLKGLDILSAIRADNDKHSARAAVKLEEFGPAVRSTAIHAVKEMARRRRRRELAKDSRRRNQSWQRRRAGR